MSDENIRLDQGPMMEAKLHFRGPFTFRAGDRCLFHCALAAAPCVYLWTIKSDLDSLYWIHYGGEAACFAKRQREHLIGILGLNYGIFDATQARNGIQKRIYDGLWRDKTADGPLKQLDTYAKTNLQVLKYVESLDVFAAEATVDRRYRQQIEGSIGWSLRNNHKRYKALYPDDNHVGTVTQKLGIVLRISADRPVAGLDERLEI
jgi:hypothetical protein